MYTFEIDEKTGKTIDRLKSVYAVKSRAAVLKRALALAILAVKYAGKDKTLRVLHGKKEILISLE